MARLLFRVEYFYLPCHVSCTNSSFTDSCTYDRNSSNLQILTHSSILILYPGVRLRYAMGLLSTGIVVQGVVFVLLSHFILGSCVMEYLLL